MDNQIDQKLSDLIKIRASLFEVYRETESETSQEMLEKAISLVDKKILWYHEFVSIGGGQFCPSFQESDDEGDLWVL